MVSNVPGETVQFLVLTEPSNGCAPTERSFQHSTNIIGAKYIYSESDCSERDLSGIPGFPAVNRSKSEPLSSLDTPVLEEPDVHATTLSTLKASEADLIADEVAEKNKSIGQKRGTTVDATGTGSDTTDFHGTKPSTRGPSAPVHTPTTRPTIDPSFGNTICFSANITSAAALEIETSGFPLPLKTKDCVTVSIHYKEVSNKLWTSMCSQHDLWGQDPEPSVVDPKYCQTSRNLRSKLIQFYVQTEPSNGCVPIERATKHNNTVLSVKHIYSGSECSESEQQQFLNYKMVTKGTYLE